MFRHRFQSAVSENCTQRLRTFFYYFPHQRSFRLCERIKNKLSRVGDLMLRLNANPYSHEFSSINRGDYRFQTVMAPGRATFAYANLSQRQGQIIRDHDQPGRVSLMLCQQTRNSVAAQVHESLWLYEHDRNSLKLGATD